MARRTCRDVHRTRCNGKLVSQHMGDALGTRFILQMQRDAAIVAERKRDVGARECNAPHRFGAMGKLGRFALQKLAARRHAAKQLFDFDHRAFRQRGGPRRCIPSAAECESAGTASAAAGEREARHRRNRCKRFAAKAK